MLVCVGDCSEADQSKAGHWNKHCTYTTTTRPHPSSFTPLMSFQTRIILPLCAISRVLFHTRMESDAWLWCFVVCHTHTQLVGTPVMLRGCRWRVRVTHLSMSRSSAWLTQINIYFQPTDRPENSQTTHWQLRYRFNLLFLKLLVILILWNFTEVCNTKIFLLHLKNKITIKSLFSATFISIINRVRILWYSHYFNM